MFDCNQGENFKLPLDQMFEITLINLSKINFGYYIQKGTQILLKHHLFSILQYH